MSSCHLETCFIQNYVTLRRSPRSHPRRALPKAVATCLSGKRTPNVQSRRRFVASTRGPTFFSCPCVYQTRGHTRSICGILFKTTEKIEVGFALHSALFPSVNSRFVSVLRRQPEDSPPPPINRLT